MRLLSAFLLAAALSGSARAEDLPAAARRVADSLAKVLASSPEGAGVRQIALLPLGEPVGAPGPGRIAAELIAARLTEVARVKVLDPAALRTVLGEQKLGAMLGRGGADDPELASRAGAQAAITGQVVADGDRLTLSVRLQLVSGGRTLGTAQATADGAVRAGATDAAGVEVAIRRLADGLAAGFARLPGNARYRRLAVLPFAEVGDGAERRKLGTIVAAELATNLRRDKGLLLVERARLGEVLGELKRREMLSPDAAQASRIGQLADAQALVIGSVAEAGDRYLVTSRIVATETGETLASESVSMAAANLVAVASDAVVLRSRGDAVFRSLVPGLGQSYNRQPAKGLAFAGAVLGLAGGAVAFHLAAESAHDDYLAVDGGTPGSPSAEATRLYELADSRYRTRNWLVAGAAAVWALNLVDAWASGVDGKQMLSGGVGAAPVPVRGGAGVAVAWRF